MYRMFPIGEMSGRMRLTYFYRNFVCQHHESVRNFIWFFHHDNALSHNCVAVLTFLTKIATNLSTKHHTRLI